MNRLRKKSGGKFPITTALKIYFGINLTKEVKDMYNKN
jgi:hypothetical protein